MDLPVNYHATPVHKRKAVREEYVRIQEGMCMHCHGTMNKLPPQSILDKPINWALFPKYFMKHPIHLQHNHSTGLTEGAVHAYCNAVLWQYHGR